MKGNIYPKVYNKNKSENYMEETHKNATYTANVTYSNMYIYIYVYIPEKYLKLYVCSEDILFISVFLTSITNCVCWRLNVVSNLPILLGPHIGGGSSIWRRLKPPGQPMHFMGFMCQVVLKSLHAIPAKTSSTNRCWTWNVPNT